MAMAAAIDVGIRLTPPYGKSAPRRTNALTRLQQCASPILPCRAANACCKRFCTRRAHKTLTEPLDTLHASVALGCRPPDDMSPEEKPRMTYSSKVIVRDCRVGFRRARDDIAGAGADRAGMQRQIPGRQDRRHARRPEVERFPQGPVRRRCHRRRRLPRQPPLRRRRRRQTPSRSRRRKPPLRRPHRQGPAVFPYAVDPKYSKETAGKARMHTCVDQYKPTRPPTPMAA